MAAQRWRREVRIFVMPDGVLDVGVWIIVGGSFILTYERSFLGWDDWLGAARVGTYFTGRSARWKITPHVDGHTGHDHRVGHLTPHR